MSEEQKQAGQVNGQQAGDQANGQAKEQEKAQAKKEFSSDEAAVLLKENMKLKKALKAHEEEQNKLKEEELKAKGDYEKLAATLTEKQQKLNQKLIETEIRALCASEGMTDMDFAALVSRSSITLSDDGEIQGAKEAVAALKTSKPTIFGQAKVPGTPTPGSTAPASGYKTWADYSAAPEADRIAWASKHPQAFKALADKAKAKS